MVVILNNGIKVKVDQQTVQLIFQNIIKGDAKQWQCQFNTVGGNKNPLTGFNLSQVSAICAEEDFFVEPAGTLQEIGLFLDSLSVDDAHGRYWAEKFRRFVLDKKSTR